MTQTNPANDFGSLLKQYRRTATDPQRGGPLTQERLGELLGEAFGGAGYTGGAISEWERNKSKIEKDQRVILVALIRVLHQNGGITSHAEADQFLLAGNYRPLDDHEAGQIFHNYSHQPDVVSATTAPTADLPEKMSQVFQSLWQKMADSASDTPWHETFLNGMGWASDLVSAELVLKAIFWLGIGWLNWQMTYPLVNWPFETIDSAWRAVVMYSAGTIIIPLLIAGMCRTNQIVYWRQQQQTNNPSLRFFTHLGASVGYQVGTMATIAVALLAYDIAGFVCQPWLFGLGSLWALVLGLASARQIPHNQWRAYHKLHWKEAGAFVIFFTFGPFCGIAFFLYYPWLLSPVPGILLMAISAVVLAIFSIQQTKKST